MSTFTTALRWSSLTHRAYRDREHSTVFAIGPTAMGEEDVRKLFRDVRLFLSRLSHNSADLCCAPSAARSASCTSRRLATVPTPRSSSWTRRAFFRHKQRTRSASTTKKSRYTSRGSRACTLRTSRSRSTRRRSSSSSARCVSSSSDLTTIACSPWLSAVRHDFRHPLAKQALQDFASLLLRPVCQSRRSRSLLALARPR